MTMPFGEWIHRLIAAQTTVAIGEGENKLGGTIVAYDEHHGVVTFQTGRTRHYIPLTSIRSFAFEESDGGSEYCTMELFKR